MNILYLGYLSPDLSKGKNGTSIAGNYVQRRIISALKCLGSSVQGFVCYSGRKSGRLFEYKKALQEKDILFAPTLQVPLLRDLFYGLLCTFRIIKKRPNLIVLYNLYFFSNVLVLILSKFFRIKTILIVQDFSVGNSFKIQKRLHDHLAAFNVKYFSCVISVSQHMARYFNVPGNKSLVFQGELEPLKQVKKTEQARKSAVKIILAGALEKHNGVDVFIDNLQRIKFNFQAEIYGDGNLRDYVVEKCSRDSRINYMGTVSKKELDYLQREADFNCCFRFSIGLAERFFFPSKFFSVNSFPGFVLVNGFAGLPKEYLDIGFIVENDFSNLSWLISNAHSLSWVTTKRQSALKAYTWESILREALDICETLD
ncbi:hypothetical protein [Pseudidiomarina mangrovi]|uniref:hypothetical protein n=1 Tax=Pseudidiomarina mangrovi TaxID=2487133 RepID=UPI000FCC440B|nr:hypothetical protein [Pseudidiomarina mangrovi]